MKIRLILLSAMFLTLSSCWTADSVEDAKVGLDIGTQQLIPYQKDQQINFIDSKGHTFDFTVIRNDLKWDSSGEPPCSPKFFPKTIHYTNYQTKTVTLISEDPNIYIQFTMQSQPKYAGFVGIDINSFYTKIYFDKSNQFVPNANDGNSILHDSIVINDKTYNNVIEVKLKGDGNDSFESILYNELGLLQIKTSDDETFSINN